MRFSKLNHEEKLELQKLLSNTIEALGGQFNFFTMLEDIRESKKHPLSNKTGKLHFKTGTISWDKHIFEDKVDILKQITIKCKEDNILSVENEKFKKQILNTAKTISKLEFTVNNKTNEASNLLVFKAFKTLDNENIEFDPIFQIIFLDSINNTKNILKYK
ncbi:MAG: hypothetical protein U9Q33_06780 [Campylobacterota bacterium]|nr:hypothetical protein [Campylobacterota bacterium]